MFDVPAARVIVARDFALLARLAASVAPDEWDGPTRCPDWTRRQLCGHVALAAHQQAEAFRRAVTGTMEPPAYPGAPSLGEGEIVPSLLRAAADLDAALGGLTPEAVSGLCPMPFGVVPTMVGVQVAVYEYAIHADDLREAVGAEGTLAAEVAATFLGFLPGLAPMLALAAAPGRPAVAYRLQAPSGTVTLEPGEGTWEIVGEARSPLCQVAGPDDAVVLFAMGRVGADDRRLTVSGPAAAAAAEFKRWFPGP